MQQIIDFGTGLFFKFSVSIMILGLLRLLIITILDIRNAYKNAGDKNIKYSKIIRTTLGWLLPVKNFANTKIIFSIFSILFHIGLILVPVFLYGHIIIWRKAFGFGWPVFNRAVADTLTILTIAGGLILLGYRIFPKYKRNLSSARDYFFLLLILLIFVSGYLIPRRFNPLGFENTMVIHIIAGNFAMIIFPFTRLAHCVLYPFIRLASDVAWHFPRNAGKELNKILYGKENRKI